ncbi:MAG: molybdopterin molybdotransferase MoeA [Candidatus Fermentibacteraceae bacterium]|nr:molybdopterin molybdotransferase MoeA [Candidatus Fermentibacteraceae bacterium]MBN2607584.1 molybdopterin molybdotransferase MoeA [Candidatus Fermentibacteraceae bacterium]
MVQAEEALRIALESSDRVGELTVTLDSACGLILAEDIHADTDLPCIDAAACDGFALRGGELRYEIPMKNSMEDPGSVALSPGKAFPVLRGDPLPEGTDRIVPAAEATVEDTVIYLDRIPMPGANVHSRGESASTGQLVLERGSRLSQQHLGIAALAGREVLRVCRRPVTGLMSVGERIVPSTWRPAPGRSRDPVIPLLKGQLRCCGFTPRMTVQASPERERLTSALRQATGCCEVLLVSGGAGPVSEALEDMGFSFLFRMVAQHPAGSFACSKGPGGETVFLLPDEPLPAMISTEEYVLPCLRRMSGFKGCRKRVYAGETTFDYGKEPGRMHFLAVLAYREGNDWKLHLPDPGIPGDLMGSMSVNALAVAGADQLSVRAGDLMSFHFLCSAAGELSFA